MMVWGFNCWGVCITLIELNKIDQWNAEHGSFSKKIVKWKEK